MPDGCDALGEAGERYLKKGTDETIDVKIFSKTSASNVKKEVTNENDL